MSNPKWVWLALIGLAGCNLISQGPQDPKRRLEEYIQKSFSVRSVQDRRELLSHLTGDARTRLEAWSDEQFRDAFIDTHRETPKLVIREVKQVNPTLVNITYELSYVDKTKGRDAKVTNKKLCEVVQEGGKWLIRDVHSIKELIEYQHELSLP